MIILKITPVLKLCQFMVKSGAHLFFELKDFSVLKMFLHPFKTRPIPFEFNQKTLFFLLLISTLKDFLLFLIQTSVTYQNLFQKLSSSLHESTQLPDFSNQIAIMTWQNLRPYFLPLDSLFTHQIILIDPLIIIVIYFENQKKFS
jgi:hypothetical protein